MELLILRRLHTSKHGTVGVISYNKNEIYTLELPWKNNASNISCIPSGNYTSRLYKHPVKGRVFTVDNVPQRYGILIHIGNYLSQTHGCILVGDALREWPDGEINLVRSRDAMDRLRAMVDELTKGENAFTLSIVWTASSGFKNGG